MKNRCFGGAIACAGAVIGAGFASGREVVGFFTRYGAHSWWLILLSAGTMMGLCALCTHETLRCNGGECWCALFDTGAVWLRTGAQLCTMLLMAITGGAMLSASGHMVALVWNSEWAYSIGAAGTLAAAWLLGFASMRPLSWLSGALTAIFLAAILAAMAARPEQPVVQLAQQVSIGELIGAAVRAVAYAAMNLTLALGVVCRCAQESEKGNRRLAVCFGMMITVLLWVSDRLYSMHPELMGEDFPIVMLLGEYGWTGFLGSVLLLYLSIFTTLTAVLYALRCAVETYVSRRSMCAVITLGLPLAVSCVGFSGIVDGLYAPAGLLCLVLVFGPLMRRQSQT